MNVKTKEPRKYSQKPEIKYKSDLVSKSFDWKSNLKGMNTYSISTPKRPSIPQKFSFSNNKKVQDSTIYKQKNTY